MKYQQDTRHNPRGVEVQGCIRKLLEGDVVVCLRDLGLTGLTSQLMGHSKLLFVKATSHFLLYWPAVQKLPVHEMLEPAL